MLPPLFTSTAPPPAISDYAVAGAGFFTSIRIPAALLAASSLSDAFRLASAAKDPRFATPAWKRLTTTYTLVMLFAFGCPNYDRDGRSHEHFRTELPLP